MARKPVSSNQDPMLDISPLIDLSFLLLIYFLVTSTLEPVESDLGMTMPGGMERTTRQFDFDIMELEVNDDGHIVANGEVLDTASELREVPLLLDRLKTYAASARLTNSEPRVRLTAADGSKGQRFIDVINALADKEVDISEILLAGF
jgi:biopolymer transport protein ExbD